MGFIGRKSFGLASLFVLLGCSEASALSEYSVTNAQLPLKVERLASEGDTYLYRASLTNLGPGSLGCSAQCKEPVDRAYPRGFSISPFGGFDAETYLSLSFNAVFDRADDRTQFEADLTDPNCVRIVVPEGEFIENDNGENVPLTPGPTKSFNCYIGSSETYLNEGQTYSVEFGVPRPNYGQVFETRISPGMGGRWQIVNGQIVRPGEWLTGKNLQITNELCSTVGLRRVRLGRSGIVRPGVDGNDNGCKASIRVNSLVLGKKKIKVSRVTKKKLVKAGEQWRPELEMSEATLAALRKTFRKKGNQYARLSLLISMDGPNGIAKQRGTVELFG